MTELIKNKIRQIFEISEIAKNLARRKFILEMLLGIISARNVQFNEISLHILSRAKTASTERRIQAFFKTFKFDYYCVASLLLSLMPVGKLKLCIDRTEWDFGLFQCNILVISVEHTGIGIPLFWELLANKSGNSATSDRIDLLQKAINLIGISRIERILGDREFIGKKWLNWLKSNHISFCIRMPKHHHVQLKNGQKYTITDLLGSRTSLYLRGSIVDEMKCNVFIKKLKKNEYLFLIGDSRAKKLAAQYRCRWSIEVCFQAIKGRGFDLEKSHLREAEKMKKLIALVSISLAFCINFGILLDEKKRKIKIKKNKYKAQSFFRHGMDAIRKMLKGKEEGEELYSYFFKP